YRQSSFVIGRSSLVDPDNRLFSRMNRRRLEGEAVRDAALAASGLLNLKMGGPGVYPPVPTEVGASEKVWPVTKDEAEQHRRSLYIFVRRNVRFPLLETFDSPDTNLSCPRREVSTTAPQALALMNGPDMQAAARAFAGRVARDAGLGTAARINCAYRLALGRFPSPRELELATTFLVEREKAMAARGGDPAQLALR